jgi:two-component system, cell cycle sensor histidine kinase and response regulator CckA
MNEITQILLQLPGPLWALLGAALVSLIWLIAFMRVHKRKEEESREAIQKLEGWEARLRAITRAMPDLVMVLDEDGRYLELYTVDEKRLVAPRAVMVGRTVFECLPSESAKFIYGTLHKALASHDVLTVEYPLKVQAGKLWLEARVVAMDTHIDGKRGVVWVSRDITERRRQEESQRQSQKLESLGVLAGGIAHDFNNLLMVMQGNLDLLQMHLPKESSLARYIEKTATAIHKASDLAGQMLAFSGRAEFHPQHMDLNQVLYELEGPLRASLPKTAELEIRMLESLPAVQCDKTQLQHVIVNLVTNASEAIGNREGRITITLGTVELDQDFINQHLSAHPVEPGLHTTLEVSDTGCGMTPEVLDRIFDPFFTTKRTGRGLGLSTLLGILRGHKVGILIQTAPGEGSSFKLFFPARSAHGEVPAAVDEGREWSAPKGTVLVVDDEPEVREAIRGLAELMGMGTLEAGNGIRALHVLEAEHARIDVVLLDLTMPRMNGYETFKAIREAYPGMPVVFSSGYSVQELSELPLNEPKVGFIQKPYRMKALQQVLASVLEEPQQ